MLWIIGLVRERTKRPVGEGLSSEMADWYQIGIGLADMSKIGIPWDWSMIYIGMPIVVSFEWRQALWSKLWMIVPCRD